MNKYYKVFISSTYADLKEERRYVMQGLIEMDCIPAGMELFPAADEEQWEFIKKIIDNCDYYLLIIGGKYGSTTSDGISYTEKEYDYAVEKGLKIICLMHKNPDLIPLGKSERDPEKQKKLTAFCDKAKTGRLIKFWEKPEELQVIAVSSLNNAIRNHPAIGYVRADLVPGEDTVSEILKLRNQITELEMQLESISTSAPLGSEELSQGDDLFEIKFNFSVYENYRKDATYSATFELSWNEIFSSVAPLLVNEAMEPKIKNQLNILIFENTHEYYLRKKQFSGKDLSAFEIEDKDFQLIKVQLKSLGLITQATKNRSVKDRGTYWTLTSYGDMVMTRLIAIKKNR